MKSNLKQSLVVGMCVGIAVVPINFVPHPWCIAVALNVGLIIGSLGMLYRMSHR